MILRQAGVCFWHIYFRHKKKVTMKAIWKGGISFGLVYIPVTLYSGVTTHRLDLDMVRKGDACPIKYTRICKEDGKEVDWDDIAKGFKQDDYYVILEEDDFEKARAEKSKSIDITDFVKTEEINPRYFEKPYLIEPQEGAEKSYSLLRQAIVKSGMGGLAKFVLRHREHLALLMADEDVIYMIRMRFYADLRSAGELNLPEKKKPSKKELDMALELIDKLKTSFEPKKYKDDYQKRLKKIIKAKAEDKEFKPSGQKKKKKVTEDLVSQLKESIEKTS